MRVDSLWTTSKGIKKVIKEEISSQAGFRTESGHCPVAVDAGAVAEASVDRQMGYCSDRSIPQVQ